MIRINLLPHREAAKKLKKEAFITSCMVSALVGALLACAGYLAFQGLLDDQQTANDRLKSENDRLKLQIRDVAAIEAEIAALKARQEAVENLQSERNLPVQLLNAVLKEVPTGAYIESLKQTDKTVSLRGKAQSNQTVADLLDNLSDQELWETKPDLVESKSSSVTLANAQQRRVFDYNVNFSLQKRPTDSVAQ